MNFQHYTTWIVGNGENVKTKVARVIFLNGAHHLDMIKPAEKFH